MPAPLLHSSQPLSKTWFNRIFSLVYTAAVAILLFRHCRSLIDHPTSVSVLLFLADVVLAFLWLTAQTFHWKPIERKVFPENLKQAVKESEYPGIDVFICTADPTKEPPIGVVNTALSVLAYDYPTEKLSVYVSVLAYDYPTGIRLHYWSGEHGFISPLILTGLLIIVTIIVSLNHLEVKKVFLNHLIVKKFPTQ